MHAVHGSSIRGTQSDWIQGATLQEKRAKQGKTQQAISAEVGTSPGLVRRYLTALQVNPVTSRNLSAMERPGE